MTLHDAPEFIMFIEQRRELNERLDATRVQIDHWITAYEFPSPIMQIAVLEGMLIERRDLLQDLAKLDDAFIDYLLRSREGS